MAATYHTAEYWRQNHPGVVLIIATNTGKQRYLRPKDELPEGMFRLLGYL